MNKRCVLVLSFAAIFILFLSSFALSADNETASSDSIANAYSCLDKQISERGNLSLKEATFAALALGAKGNIASRIDAEKDTNAACWPRGACKAKETAQVALAYNRMGKDASAIKNWLLYKNVTTPELKWLLEIDIANKVAANCTINDGQRDNKIKILEDMRIQGSLGSCLSLNEGGFMLKINQNCIRNSFKITCDEDFFSSIVYQKNTGGTLYILPDTQSAAGYGSTEAKVNGECLKSDSVCDYEGTLWGALALKKLGEDVSRFLPYLLAMADENGRYFPSAFLYILVGGDDQYNLVIQQQKQGKFWEMIGTRDGRYYDTSLALLSLGDRGGAEVDATRAYLTGIQTKEGCWNSNNVRDTAFLLYSGWPKGAVSAGQISSPPDCEPTFSCENSFDCTQASGTAQNNYACPNVGEICCSVKVQQQTCEQKAGLLCPSGTQCDGRVESASDGVCCFGGSCIATTAGEDTCTPAGGACKSVCEGKETESVETCSTTGEVCCIAAGSSLWGWIIVLLVLIILIILAIVYREKVKIWWFKFREWIGTKFGKKPAQPAPGQRPMAPFAPSARPMMQPMMRPRPMPLRPVAKDKEMEEALRKLREMSKK